MRMEPWIILPLGLSLLLCTAESDREQGPAQGQLGMLVVGDAAHRAAHAGCCPPTPRAQAGSQLLRVTLQGQQEPLRNQTAVVDKARSTITYYITSQSNLSAVVLYDSRNVSAGASLPPQLCLLPLSAPVVMRHGAGERRMSMSGLSWDRGSVCCLLHIGLSTGLRVLQAAGAASLLREEDGPLGPADPADTSQLL